MSFFLHWGSRLLATFPQPPVPVLAAMELALRRADTELAAHLGSLSVGALSYGWPLLRSAFSEVLAREDWLRLVDRVLANEDRPELLEAAAVAFVMASRLRLLSIKSTEEAKGFFRRRQSVDLREMFRVMERVAKISGVGGGAERPRGRRKGGECSGGGGGDCGGGDAVDLTRADAFRKGGTGRGRERGEGRGEGEGGWGRGGGERRRESGDVDGTMAALALLGSAPCGFKPLPVGTYPHYDGFPQFVVNYQAELRERVAKQECEMECKRRMVRDGRITPKAPCVMRPVVAAYTCNFLP